MTDTASTVPPLRIAPPPPGWGPGSAAVGMDPDRLARRAVIFGILSLVANVVLLPSIIGILYGSRALRRGTLRRGEAIAGVVTGSVGLVVSIVALLLVLLPFVLVNRGAVLEHRIEQQITADMARQGTTLTDVACPEPASPAAGTRISCTARAEGIGPVRVDLTFTSPSSFTGQVVRAG